MLKELYCFEKYKGFGIAIDKYTCNLYQGYVFKNSYSIPVIELRGNSGDDLYMELVEQVDKYLEEV